MSRTVRLALCQINPYLGDLKGNVSKIVSYIKKGEDLGADIIAFPELAITGYPPEDLLLRQQFIEDNIAALHDIACTPTKAIVIVGLVDRVDDIYNAAAIIYDCKVRHVYHKMHLPTYSVFDEDRYFKAGEVCPVYRTPEFSFGVNICEDIWYPEGPAYIQALGGAELIVNINASPFHYGKAEFRKKMLCTRAHDASVAIAYVNICGGQDELVFDGGAMVIDPYGTVIAEAPRFREHLLVVDIDLDESYKKRLHDPRGRKRISHFRDRQIQIIEIPYCIRPKRPITVDRIQSAMVVEQEVYEAIVTGTRDYVQKNGFKEVCLGLSGGVDSSLVAKIAVDAIGKEHVHAVFMSSSFTSQESREDAYGLATNLGIRIVEIPIKEAFDTYCRSLAALFDGLKWDITEENLQSRIRGTLLMALSNKFGYLLLTTGNKSEMAVGYATLYGDMAGGFAPLKDVSKTMVYRICHWLNSIHPVIPARVIAKEPTAELREGQKDTDTLPPYDVLDRVIEAYVEQDRDINEIALMTGIDRRVVEKSVLMMDRSEYKRRQSPPGVKVTQRAFGRDRRFPITNGYNRG